MSFHSVSTHLLGEATKELVEELWEDENDILGEDKKREREREQALLQKLCHSFCSLLFCIYKCIYIFFNKQPNPRMWFRQGPHLVEEVLHKLRDSYVVIVSVDQQHLFEVFKLWDGIVAVSNGLTTLLTHDT